MNYPGVCRTSQTAPSVCSELPLCKPDDWMDKKALIKCADTQEEPRWSIRLEFRENVSQLLFF